MMVDSNSLAKKLNDENVILIEDLKYSICHTPAWKKLWSKTLSIIKSSAMKYSILQNRDIQNGKFSIQESNGYCSRFELVVLGLLWCDGTQHEKALVLWRLCTIQQQEGIQANDKKLMLVFSLLMYFSYDFTLKNANHAGKLQMKSKGLSPSRGNTQSNRPSQISNLSPYQKQNNWAPLHDSSDQTQSMFSASQHQNTPVNSNEFD